MQKSSIGVLSDLWECRTPWHQRLAEPRVEPLLMTRRVPRNDRWQGQDGKTLGAGLHLRTHFHFSGYYFFFFFFSFKFFSYQLIYYSFISVACFYDSTDLIDVIFPVFFFFCFFFVFLFLFLPKIIIVSLRKVGTSKSFKFDSND